MILELALLSLLGIVPDAPTCRANHEAALKYAAAFPDDPENDYRPDLWCRLALVHDRRASRVLEALYFASECKVHEPRVGIWPAPIPVR